MIFKVCFMSLSKNKCLPHFLVEVAGRIAAPIWLNWVDSSTFLMVVCFVVESDCKNLPGDTQTEKNEKHLD